MAAGKQEESQHEKEADYADKTTATQSLGLFRGMISK